MHSLLHDIPRFLILFLEELFLTFNQMLSIRAFGRRVMYFHIFIFQFIEKFKEVKDLTRQQVLQNQSPITVNGTDTDSNQSTPRDSSAASSNRGFFHTRSSSLTSMRDAAVCIGTGLDKKKISEYNCKYFLIHHF